MSNTEFNPEATDGDGDGMVQDGTPFERPIEQLHIDPTKTKSEKENTRKPAKAESKVVSSEEPVRTRKPKPSVQNVNNAIGSASIKTDEPVIENSLEKEKVALFSTKNMSWQGVGKIHIGYNIVSKEASQKWLAYSHVRLATPEEVAREFSV
jgi:hypothetical protein